MSVNKIGNYRWRVVALLFFATTINYIDRQVLGMLKPYIADDLGITEAGYGYIVSAFQAAYALGLLFVGRLIDKYGTRITYAISIAIWSLAGCFHAAARGAFGFGLARFMLGIGESANFPSAVKATAEWFPKKERALATGIFNSGSNIGAVVAPIIVTAVTLKWGWQWAFIVTGLLGFIWMAFWLPMYKLPKDAKGLKKSEFDHINQDGVEEETKKEKIAWSQLLKFKGTIGICLSRFVCDWVWWFFLFWAPDFLNKTHGVDLSQMQWALIVIYTFAAFGGVAGGGLSSLLIKRGCSVPFSRKAAMLVCALCVVPVISLAYAKSLWIAIALISLACFAHQGWASNIYTLVSDYYPKNMVATLTSLAGFCGSVGGVLASSFVGNILEWTGSYLVVFMIAGLAYVAAWLCLQIFLPRDGKAYGA
ncbi:MAG: MFS transporter [Bacteroidales bacterium]|nr:MFS transporter [Bacteroidales bacterium]MBO7232789.1 MFS transporter [Bacteroidales bacterium]MBO7270398.1 MFS transporter [Bacteroidales bacterium]MBQ2448324.1 MFS transporter [Bacteroidales bacterium]MBQ5604110.1 MFS transporter [Bacteroidales bacterium]